jgi:hypothetical protein
MKILYLAALAGMFAFPAAANPVTVVELYQSQGCSSCPPAIANVNQLADRPDVLALTFAVTYWDRLGWKDTFGKPEFTARQYSYSHGFHRRTVYTPQVIVNGQSDLVGTDSGDLQKAISRALPLAGPAISFAGNTVSVSGAPASEAADVWLVRYDPRVLSVPIGRGENSGIAIAHRNVVRELVRLGSWEGTARDYPVPTPGDMAWRSAVLVEAKNGGAILSAARL